MDNEDGLLDLLKDKLLQKMNVNSSKLFDELRKQAREINREHLEKEKTLQGLPTEDDIRHFDDLNFEINQLKNELQVLNEKIKCFHNEKEKQEQIESLKEANSRHLLINETKQEILKTIFITIVKEIIDKFKSNLEALLTVPSTAVFIVEHEQHDAKEQYKVYGLLLSACKIKEKFCGADDEQDAVLSVANLQLIPTDLNKWQIDYLLQRKTDALKLTQQMLKLLPPLVVCRPVEYHEEIHDTNRATWDEEKKDGKLTYYRPILVYSNHLHIAAKGLVGNNLDIHTRVFESIGTQTDEPTDEQTDEQTDEPTDTIQAELSKIDSIPNENNNNSPVAEDLSTSDSEKCSGDSGESKDNSESISKDCQNEVSDDFTLQKEQVKDSSRDDNVSDDHNDSSLKCDDISVDPNLSLEQEKPNTSKENELIPKNSELDASKVSTKECPGDEQRIPNGSKSNDTSHSAASSKDKPKPSRDKKEDTSSLSKDRGKVGVRGTTKKNAKK